MSAIRKIRKSLRTRGLAGSARFLGQLARQVVKSRINRAARRARADAARAEGNFDPRFNIDTKGFIPVSNLKVSTATWMDGNAYQGIGVDVDFEQVLAHILGQEEIVDCTFIDLGSGKGRAVLLAARLPFRSVVGVEFSAELHRIAKQNLARWPVEQIRAQSVKFEWADAATYALPEGPLIVFMYNPFGLNIMARVAERIALHKDRVVVVYFTPRQAQLFDSLSRLHRVRNPAACVVWDSAA
jgi:hypothetical protein